MKGDLKMRAEARKKILSPEASIGSGEYFASMPFLRSTRGCLWGAEGRMTGA